MKQFNLHVLLRILRKRWLLIFVLTTIVTSFTMVLNVKYLVPKYSNSTTLLVNDRNRQGSGLRVDDILLYEKLMGTYKDILLSRRILSDVTDKIAPSMSPAQLRGLTSVAISTNSQVITIRVMHQNYEMATRLANGIAESFRAKLGTLIDVDNVQILDTAESSSNPRPVSPRVKFNTFLAFFLGLIFSSSLAVIFAFFDTRIRSEEDIRVVSNLPLLGIIPASSPRSRKSVISREEKHA